MTLRDIITYHAQRYPLMQPTDYAKLAYQSAFAGGHMISDPQAALAWLRREMAALSAEPADVPLWDAVGGGLTRLHLLPVKRLGLRPDTIAAMFTLTANGYQPSKQRFAEAMHTMADMAASGSIDVNGNELLSLLSECASQNYAPFSHSEAYRQAYAPAYRVVDGAYMPLLPIMAAIDARLSAGQTVTLAIDGRCASGKSTMAAQLAAVYDAQLFHMDDYFLPFSRKTPERLAQPGGNVDYERFRAEVICHLNDDTLTYRPFNCATGELDAPVTTHRQSVQIIEGAYAMHPAMQAHYDIRVFSGIGSELQMARIARRNPDKVQRFKNEWIPYEEHYISAFAIDKGCDITMQAENTLEVQNQTCAY